MIIMGNDNSILDECKLESKKIVEVGEWQLHHGTWQKNGNYSRTNGRAAAGGCGEENAVKITLFERKLSPNGSRREMEFHENATKYLKVFRHPSIVKYYHSGHKNNSTLFLITERVEPLTRKLQFLSELEICAGLHSILQALVFCHEMCKARHNNFGMESVYVTPDGVWKLSGMEFLCFQTNLDESFLDRNRAFRNESLIPPEEMEGKFSHLTECGYAGDVYTMGLFAKCLLEIIIKRECLPGAKEFMDQIKKEVLIGDPTLRPPMKNLLNNKFFQNDFLDIHTFLMNLTLKVDSEKENFFRTLAPRLFRLPEKLVAVRLADLLLSRFVLLDPSANEFFLPHFFRPYRGAGKRVEFIEDQVNPLLSASLYKEHIIPKLRFIFEVLDVDIRTILLTYFEHYVDLFDPEELTKKILPQILLGIRDINNNLVATSLRALATMVPLLGSHVVIGGKRAQFFTEAKPKENCFSAVEPADEVLTGLSDIIETTKRLDALATNNGSSEETSSDTIDTTDSAIPLQGSAVAVASFRVFEGATVPEDPSPTSPSPDGTENPQTIADEEDDAAWSDWDGADDGPALEATTQTPRGDFDGGGGSSSRVIAENVPNSSSFSRKSGGEQVPTQEPISMSKSKKLGLGEEFDVMAIEVRKQPTQEEEVNFFQDMQPVIRRPSRVLVFRDAAVEEGGGAAAAATQVPAKCADLSFAVDDKVEVTPNGWCEDLEWDEDL